MKLELIKKTDATGDVKFEVRIDGICEKLRYVYDEAVAEYDKIKANNAHPGEEVILSEEI